MKLNLNHYQNIKRMFFGTIKKDKNSLINKIINQLKDFKIDGAIETTIYPFVLEEKIKISLTEKESINIFNNFQKNKLKNEIYEIDMKTCQENIINELQVKYNNQKILLKNYSIILIENKNKKTIIYIKLILSEFEKREEGKIKEYCMDSVDKHVDKIVNGGKSKTKSKNKSQFKGPK